ncbi:MAG: hypothetical protein AB7D36_09035 [Oscillospiraceae bacterium]
MKEERILSIREVLDSLRKDSISCEECRRIRQQSAKHLSKKHAGRKQELK